MNKYISDDRLDMKKLIKKICAMTNEEFEQYIEKVKKEYSLTKQPINKTLQNNDIKRCKE